MSSKVEKTVNGNQGLKSTLYLWNGMSAFLGSSFMTSPHMHNTLQLVFGVDREFALKDQLSDWKLYSSAVINASHMHQFDSREGIQLFIYLAIESEYGIRIRNRFLRKNAIANLGIIDLKSLGLNWFRDSIGDDKCENLFGSLVNLLDQLLQVEQVTGRDERVEKAIAYISAPENQPIKVGTVAKFVFLSESRLRVLFKKHVGQSIQSFIVWTKVLNSIHPMLSGKPLNDTALTCGFWDSSHMSRSYKELLGISPGELDRFSQSVRIIPCREVNFYSLRTAVHQGWNDRPYKQIEI